MLRNKMGKGSKPKLTSLSLSYPFYKIRVRKPHRAAAGIRLDNGYET
jgi:hypothetical protein